MNYFEWTEILSFKNSNCITFELDEAEAHGKLRWIIHVSWDEVNAALHLDPTKDEYDEALHNNGLCRILVASGAPIYVANFDGSYAHLDCLAVWGETVTDNDLVCWAMFHPEVAGPTDDLEALREKYMVWENSHAAQPTSNKGATQ